MRPEVVIVYNEPEASRYDNIREAKAVLSVLDEVKAAYRALKVLGYEVIKLPLKPPMQCVREIIGSLNCALVFNLFEGFEGSPDTEIAFAEILSERGIPYTGCPPSALALALDKVKTKALLQCVGIDTPRHMVLSPQDLSFSQGGITSGNFSLKYPCIVKPCGEDASHGLAEESVVGDFDSLKKQVQRVSELYRGSALVEEFLDGREFNATVMGNSRPTVLSVSEIVYSLPSFVPKILTFAAKWEPESLYFRGTWPECPAKIEDSLKERIAEICLASFKLLGCRGYARVDMRQDIEGKIYVLEINPNPDISPGYGAALQAKVAGMAYHQFIEKIVLLALGKEQK